MLEPLLADDAFLADLEAARGSHDRVRLWWLGQSGFLVEHRGRRLLVDPYLSESLTRKYAGTDKPHVRLTRRAVDPARLTGIDAVTSSHNHTDHLDGETLRAVLAANPAAAIVVPAANVAFAAERLGVAPGRLTPAHEGLPLHVRGFDLLGLPSAHETLERDAEGRPRFLGYLIRAGAAAIYHPGDTVRHEGLAEALRCFSIDVAILPINGRNPERRVPGNLTGEEAARLAHDAGARLAVPCHYEMFAFNSASPEPFAAECRRLGQACRVMRVGERLELA